MKVTLHGMSTSRPDDMDVLLFGPDVERIVLMSDACGTTRLVDAELTFASGAAPLLSDNGPCGTGTYAPTDHADVLPDSWPTGDPISSSLESLNGINPNGRWDLYVVDDLISNPTTIAGGWSIDISTGPASILVPGGPGGSGVSNPYPYEVTLAGLSGTIADVNVVIPGLSHRSPNDIDLLLVRPGGRRNVMLLSDACGFLPGLTTRPWGLMTSQWRRCRTMDHV